MIGRTLSNYKIVDKLGEGGMGTVYVARDARLERTVALKVLPADLAGDEVRRKRFLVEARAASALKNPHVAHVYDVGEAEGMGFIVMEHIEGETLADRLARSPLEPAEALRIAGQVADALAEAHGKHITHRDIKPANIMLTGRGEVKVLDFGLARRGFAPEVTVHSVDATLAADPRGDDSLTRDGQLLGTVPYMSPEQAGGEEAGPPSDVFSLGTVLYEMLAGRRPFQGRTPRETLERILAGAYPPVTEFRPGLPDPVVRVLDRCLAGDPGDRYPSAAALHEDLHALDPSSASPAGMEAQSRNPDPDRIRSIAVLPFTNGSGDAEAEYLCDGLAEGIIRTLSRIPEVRVLSRHASFGLRDEPRDIPALGARLQADALVLGELRPRGERIMVTVELVAVADESCLWGERYDRELAEAYEVEREIVDQVSRQLRDTISSQDAAELAGKQVDPRAYLLFLKGRSLLVGSAAQMEKGAEYLEQAIELDPDFALAHAVLAESYYARAYHGLVDVPEASRGARRAARNAVRLDPGSGEAQTAQALVAGAFDWDWEEADAAFRRAVEADSGRDMACLEYSEFLCVLGRLDEALVMAGRAREIDPVSPNPAHGEGYVHMLRGEYPEAAELFRAAIELHPDWIWGHIKLANTLSRAGDHGTAVDNAEIAANLLHGRGSALSQAWLARVYGAAGNEDRARTMLEALHAPGVDPMSPFYVHASLGEKEEALQCLEAAVAAHTGLCHHLIPSACLEPRLELEKEPRYLALLRRLDLPLP